MSVMGQCYLHGDHTLHPTQLLMHAFFTLIRHVHEHLEFGTGSITIVYLSSMHNPTPSAFSPCMQPRRGLSSEPGLAWPEGKITHGHKVDRNVRYTTQWCSWADKREGVPWTGHMSPEMSFALIGRLRNIGRTAQQITTSSQLHSFTCVRCDPQTKVSPARLLGHRCTPYQVTWSYLCSASSTGPSLSKPWHILLMALQPGHRGARLSSQ